mgnify:CR=1 FL=1
MPSSDPDRDLAQALQHGRCRDPFGQLGPHAGPVAGQHTLRVFVPGATRVTALSRHTGQALAELTGRGSEGLFVGALPDAAAGDYHLAVEAGGQRWTQEDPYRFGPWLGELDIWLLAEGRHHRPWQKLGAHLTTLQGVAGTAFAVDATGTAVIVGPTGEVTGGLATGTGRAGLSLRPGSRSATNTGWTKQDSSGSVSSEKPAGAGS